MKKLLAIAFLTMISIHALAQDNLWLMGYQCCAPGFGGTDLDFSNGVLSVNSVNRNMWFNATNSTMTDASGNLLFYTNGVYIANANNDTMNNGSGLCSDPYSLQGSIAGLSIPQGALALPSDINSSKYYLFHEEFDSTDSLVRPNRLMLSTIDMAQQNGLGEVTIKSSTIFNARLTHGCITACRHANGRDWWVIIPGSLNNLYYRLLVTPNSITVFSQNIGTNSTVSTLYGQSCFSPDGTKYVHIDGWNGLTLFDFDRCTGTFSNPMILSSQSLNLVQNASGVAFSSNSRFIYLSNSTKLFQLDTQNSNLLSSLILIGVYDGFSAPFPSWFYTAQLAKDGKIYISTPYGTNYLHVIKSPDSLGLGCNFQQHSIQLPNQNASTMATPPWYELRNEVGSICDSLNLNSITQVDSPQFGLVPNPSNGLVFISNPTHEKIESFKVISSAGKLILEKTNLSSDNTLDLSLETAGIYFVTIASLKHIYTIKMVKY